MEEITTAHINTRAPEAPRPLTAEILRENRRRNRLEQARGEYNPLAGIGCEPIIDSSADADDRRNRRVPHIPPFTPGPEYGLEEGGSVLIPRSMADDPELPAVRCLTDWERLRCRHDFEFWAARCVKIKNKTGAELIPFRLNRAQRRVLHTMERMRRQGEPVRIIMLKARQWGGSTLVQMYMAWIQCTRLTNWHSLICAQVGKTAAAIRGMYDEMLRNYPTDLWEGERKPRLNRYQSQELIREIAGRSCRVTLGSSERQDSVRGADYAMAHLSEVAFWKDTPKSSPTDFIRAVCGAISRDPSTLIVLESTANGVGNYFHTEWLRSARGESDKQCVFVPWYEIDIYRRERPDYAEVWNTMDSYERSLWEMGVTLERIAWYQEKRREYPTHSQMMAEYPTTAEEAFTNTGTNVFSPEGVERLRGGCALTPLRGEIASSTGCALGPRSLLGLHFSEDPAGELMVWEHPRKGARYVAAVDVGGRSVHADWSVIAILRLGEKPEVVAQWRGHIDHDLLTWKAAALGRWYNRALLVFESNTLESDDRYSIQGMPGEVPDQGTYILHELFEHYPELYYRQAPDGGTPRPGFHTNRATKQMIITELVGAVRDGSYTERDPRACDELMVYVRRANGSYGARAGFHDDILMTRAIGLHVAREESARFDPSEPVAEDDFDSYFARWA